MSKHHALLGHPIEPKVERTLSYDSSDRGIQPDLHHVRTIIGRHIPGIQLWSRLVLLDSAGEPYSLLMPIIHSSTLGTELGYLIRCGLGGVLGGGTDPLTGWGFLERHRGEDPTSVIELSLNGIVHPIRRIEESQARPAQRRASGFISPGEVGSIIFHGGVQQ